MKKYKTLTLLFLIALIIVGGWGSGRETQEEPNTDLKLSPRAIQKEQNKDLEQPPCAPILSAGSGFYEESFELTIRAKRGVDIYYTLDGSVPGVDSVLYEEPILITFGGGRESEETFVPNMTTNWNYEDGESHPNVATVLRAVAVNSDGLESECVTATYFIDQTGYEEHIVISIVADPEDLFGDKGIYVTGGEYDSWYLGGQEGPAPIPNFEQHGREWEKPAVVEFFVNTESILQQQVGIRIQGASARRGTNKRFSIYARKEYSGNGWFDIPIFGETRSHAIMLRAGFMNGYIMHLVQDRDVASADSKEVIVYLNGAHWYITIAQDKYTEKYFEEHYGVDDDNVLIVKDGQAETEDPEDQALYQAVYDFINTNDMEQNEAYEQLDQLMDIQSYIDFSCVNVYFANLDYNENKNWICWRAREPGTGEYEDGRFRWALYDMDLLNADYGFFVEDINTFTLDTRYAGRAFNTRPMYVALKQNALFRKQFVLSFMDMVNTVFTVENAAKSMENWEITLGWWGMSEEWVENFFPARTEAVTQHLAEEFALTGTMETVKLSVNDEAAGYLILNTIEPKLQDGNWSGSYFTDYPITVTAVANSGHRFVGWQSGENTIEQPEQETVTLEIPEGGLTLFAVFE